MEQIPDISSTRAQRVSVFVLIGCVLLLLGAEIVGYLIQTNSGKVSVKNVIFPNESGIPVRAKLLHSRDASLNTPLPGIVYIHGYQNNRETSDAYCIELARRGFVVLEIDAIGRGNSGNPEDPKSPTFDPTFGTRAALKYLRSLPYVKIDAVGLMGHSLGAEMAYQVALEDPGVQALSVSGFAFTTQADFQKPKNMLMIFGKYDEYRSRMTGTTNFEKEWMTSPQVKKVINDPSPEFGKIYGNFESGTARKVYMPLTTHVQESHDAGAISEALTWMKNSLKPPDSLWIDAQQQIWQIKETATMVAMLAGLATIFPLGFMLLRLPWFNSLIATTRGSYRCALRDLVRYASINGVLSWLYLPLIMSLFAIHVYVVPIDKVFPMMMVNGTVWWFMGINIIGFIILRAWLRKKQKQGTASWIDLGVSERDGNVAWNWNELGKSIILAGLLFAFVYTVEAMLEQIFLVDYRFIFPFASDLTPYRWGMMFLYFPFLLLGFFLMGLFLHGQIRRTTRKTLLLTALDTSAVNILVVVVPLLILLSVQYIPLLAGGGLPFIGPGGVMATFMINLFHIIGVLIMVVPISTWFFLLTGRIYTGATLNALLVAWMFASSQVIAPIPV